VLTGLCLLAAVPVHARNPAAAGPGRTDGRVQVAHASDSIILSGIDRPRRASTHRRLSETALEAPDEGLGDVRASPGRSVMLRSVPVYERVDVGVGLFAVTGATVKERELRRTDPMRDVAPRTSRVAGAGLRVNF